MSARAVEAARELLAAHDALKAVHEREPELGDDGLPLNRDAWLAWRIGESMPAYRRVVDARIALAGFVGGEVPTHPFNYRPLCESIIREGTPQPRRR